MPSQILHTLFGEDLLAEIRFRIIPELDSGSGKVLDGIWAFQRAAFTLGCQGPDIFYHSRGRRPVGLEYGTLLHRRGAGTFSAWLLELALQKRRQQEGSDALVAYALGFMSHAILDRAAHPYIIYKSATSNVFQTASASPRKSETLSAAHSHTFFERIIDALMFKLLRGMEISAWDQESLLAEICEKPPFGLQALLEDALVRAFPERAGKDEKLTKRIENTFHDCAYFYRLTAPAQTSYKKTPPASRPFLLKKRHLIYLFPEELPCDVDFMNLAKRPWFYPVEDAEGRKEDLRSFPELYADTVNNAADSLSGIICRYLENNACQGRGADHYPDNGKHAGAPSLREEIAVAIGDTGLSIVDKTGKPCAPGRTDPLPLDEVLETQAVLYGH